MSTAAQARWRIMRLTKDGQIGNVGCYRSEAGTGNAMEFVYRD
jgi:hypothetical protein